MQTRLRSLAPQHYPSRTLPYNSKFVDMLLVIVQSCEFNLHLPLLKVQFSCTKNVSKSISKKHCIYMRGLIYAFGFLVLQCMPQIYDRMTFLRLDHHE